MIPMTMIGKVRRMFHRQNKSVREIARLTSLSHGRDGGRAQAVTRLKAGGSGHQRRYFLLGED
ncbi:hypothetical protein GGD70_008181, partial [Paraburkholderia fungorum]|nr:hypothetical protein [Paraburkholderia fungorum]